MMAIITPLSCQWQQSCPIMPVSHSRSNTWILVFSWLQVEAAIKYTAHRTIHLFEERPGYVWTASILHNPVICSHFPLCYFKKIGKLLKRKAGQCLISPPLLWDKTDWVTTALLFTPPKLFFLCAFLGHTDMWNRDSLAIGEGTQQMPVHHGLSDSRGLSAGAKAAGHTQRTVTPSLTGLA